MKKTRERKRNAREYNALTTTLNIMYRSEKGIIYLFIRGVRKKA